jgi:hypothetical protein
MVAKEVVYVYMPFLFLNAVQNFLSNAYIFLLVLLKEVASMWARYFFIMLTVKLLTWR